MRSKKILSIVLAVVFISCSFTAFAETGDSNLECTLKGYELAGTFISETDGEKHVKMTNSVGNLYGIETMANPEVLGDTYIYTFKFSFPYTAPTGTYKITVGDDTKENVFNYFYVSVNDRIAFYDGLESKDIGEIRGYFEADTTKSPIDVSDYLGISADIEPLVDAKIKALDLSTELTGSSTEAQKVARIIELDQYFNEHYKAILDVAKIADADETEWNSVYNDSIKTNGFFIDYYTAEEGKAPLLLPGDVYTYFVTERSGVLALELELYKKAFDKATLMLIFKTKDYSILGDVFKTMTERGSITPDMENISAVIVAGKEADLWKKLKISTSYDAAALVANAESIAESMVANGVLNGGGNASGGIGGGGGGTSSSKPLTPGPSTGIVTPPETITPTPDEPQSPSKVFSDMHGFDWAVEAIEYFNNIGVLAGKSDGKFAPNDGVTREEAAKILTLAFGLHRDDAKSVEFVDVAADRWSTPYINSAVEAGIFSGYDSTTFGVSDVMTREQAAALFARIMKNAGFDFSNVKANYFSDSDAASDYAQEAIGLLSGIGVINGVGEGKFSPKEIVNRAQMATMAYRVVALLGGAE